MECDIGMCVIGVSKTTYDSCCNTPQGQDAFIRSHMLESLRLLRVLHNNYRFKDQSPLLRSVSGLLSNAPTDSNYFKLLINYIRDERFPPVSSSTYIILICFAVLHVIILVSCFVTFIWPVFHYSSNQRSKKFWLVKLIAIGGHGQGDFHSVPLILFNSGALVAFSQVTESCLSIVYIFLTYFASQSVEFAENTSTRPWACAIALFQFYSCWFMAWTLLYTRICARNPYIDPIGNKKRSRRVFHPLSLNAFFCSIPVIVTVVSGIMIYELANSSSNLSTEWNSLNGILKAGSFAWESLHNSATSVSPSDALRFQMNITTDNLKSFVEGIEVSLRLKDNVFMDQLESLLWVIALSGTCLVYLFSYWTLLRLISGGIHKFKRRVEIGLISTRMNNSGTSIARTPAQVDVHEPLTSTTSLGSKIEVSPEQASIRRGFGQL
ncbi:hypothetical protein PtA15_18A162 [Puccinia triticina]|nr:uncharacterized protein PtA15_18A162 [Puccinia triticina]WAQ93105.1 hypothetical protein PtA15_18A162 [Puccinia triticina]